METSTRSPTVGSTSYVANSPTVAQSASQQPHNQQIRVPSNGSRTSGLSSPVTLASPASFSSGKMPSLPNIPPTSPYSGSFPNSHHTLQTIKIPTQQPQTIQIPQQDSPTPSSPESPYPIIDDSGNLSHGVINEDGSATSLTKVVPEYRSETNSGSSNYSSASTSGVNSGNHSAINSGSNHKLKNNNSNNGHGANNNGGTNSKSNSSTSSKANNHSSTNGSITNITNISKSSSKSTSSRARDNGRESTKEPVKDNGRDTRENDRAAREAREQKDRESKEKDRERQARDIKLDIKEKEAKDRKEQKLREQREQREREQRDLREQKEQREREQRELREQKEQTELRELRELREQKTQNDQIQVITESDLKDTNKEPKVISAKEAKERKRLQSVPPSDLRFDRSKFTDAQFIDQLLFENRELSALLYKRERQVAHLREQLNQISQQFSLPQAIKETSAQSSPLMAQFSGRNVSNSTTPVIPPTSASAEIRIPSTGSGRSDRNIKRPESPVPSVPPPVPSKSPPSPHNTKLPPTPQEQQFTREFKESIETSKDPLYLENHSLPPTPLNQQATTPLTDNFNSLNELSPLRQLTSSTSSGVTPRYEKDSYAFSPINQTPRQPPTPHSQAIIQNNQNVPTPEIPMRSSRRRRGSREDKNVPHHSSSSSSTSYNTITSVNSVINSEVNSNNTGNTGTTGTTAHTVDSSITATGVPSAGLNIISPVDNLSSPNTISNTSSHSKQHSRRVSTASVTSAGSLPNSSANMSNISASTSFGRNAEKNHHDTDTIRSSVYSNSAMNDITESSHYNDTTPIDSNNVVPSNLYVPTLITSAPTGSVERSNDRVLHSISQSAPSSAAVDHSFNGTIGSPDRYERSSRERDRERDYREYERYNQSPQRSNPGNDRGDRYNPYNQTHDAKNIPFNPYNTPVEGRNNTRDVQSPPSPENSTKQSMHHSNSHSSQLSAHSSNSKQVYSSSKNSTSNGSFNTSGSSATGNANVNNSTTQSYKSRIKLPPTLQQQYSKDLENAAERDRVASDRSNRSGSIGDRSETSEGERERGDRRASFNERVEKRVHNRASSYSERIDRQERSERVASSSTENRSVQLSQAPVVPPHIASDVLKSPANFASMQVPGLLPPSATDSNSNFHTPPQQMTAQFPSTDIDSAQSQNSEQSEQSGNSRDSGESSNSGEVKRPPNTPEVLSNGKFNMKLNDISNPQLEEDDTRSYISSPVQGSFAHSQTSPGRFANTGGYENEPELKTPTVSEYNSTLKQGPPSPYSSNTQQTPSNPYNAVQGHQNKTPIGHQYVSTPHNERANPMQTPRLKGSNNNLQTPSSFQVLATPKSEEDESGLFIKPEDFQTINICVVSTINVNSLRQSVRKSEDPNHTISIHDRETNKEMWRIRKTFSQLVAFDNEIRPIVEFFGLPPVPDKTLFLSTSPIKIEHRRVALQNYFNTVFVMPHIPHIVLYKMCKYLSLDFVNPLDDYKSGARKEGFLVRKNKGLGSNWKVRWCQVEGPYLEVYENPGGPLIESIKLKGAQIGKQSNDSVAEDKGYRHAFLVMEPQKSSKLSSSLPKHFFCAETDRERDSWVNALVEFNDGGDTSVISGGSDATSISETPNSKNEQEERFSSYDQTSSYTSHSQEERESTGKDNKKHKMRSIFPFRSSNKNNSANSHSLLSTDSILDDVETSSIPAPPSGSQSSFPNTQHYLNQMNLDEDLTKSIFGREVGEAYKLSNQIYLGRSVPSIVARCLDYLVKTGAMYEEGIFRLSGSASTIRQLKDQFNNQFDMDLFDSPLKPDIHTVAGLLKTYLRELPAPILGLQAYNHLNTVILSNSTLSATSLAMIFRDYFTDPANVDEVHYNMCYVIFRFLRQIIAQNQINRMNLRNVCIVFVPTLNVSLEVLNTFLADFECIFENGKPVADADREVLDLHIPNF